jgi:hypothetical protein
MPSSVTELFLFLYNAMMDYKYENPYESYALKVHCIQVFIHTLVNPHM